MVEDGRRRAFGTGAPAATMVIRSPRTWPMLLRGSRGLAESYARGYWDSPDLVALIRLAARNAAALDRLRTRFGAAARAPFCACAPSSAAARAGAAAATSPRTTTSATSCSR